jgi:hypothetical protein
MRATLYGGGRYIRLHSISEFGEVFEPLASYCNIAIDQDRPMVQDLRAGEEQEEDAVNCRIAGRRSNEGGVEKVLAIPAQKRTRPALDQNPQSLEGDAARCGNVDRKLHRAIGNSAEPGRGREEKLELLAADLATTIFIVAIVDFHERAIGSLRAFPRSEAVERGPPVVVQAQMQG